MNLYGLRPAALSLVEPLASARSGSAGKEARHEVREWTLVLPGQGLRHVAGRSAGGVAVKLKLTYQPEEQEQAAGVLAALLRLLPGAKVRRDKSQAPRLCVYVTINKKGA